MDKAIKISVSKLDPYKSADFKELFRQTVDWPSDLSFDYNMMEKALQILFPGSVVEFKIFNNGTYSK